MLCPKCKTLCRLELQKGLPVYLCRDPKCPDCGKEIPVFGRSRAKELAEKFAIPAVLRLPVDPSFAAAIDAGAAETLEVPDVDSFAEKVF